jgi:hypothetical protein
MCVNFLRIDGLSLRANLSRIFLEQRILMVTVKVRQVDIACDDLSAQNRWAIAGPNAGKPEIAPYPAVYQSAAVRFGTTLAPSAVGDGSL